MQNSVERIEPTLPPCFFRARGNGLSMKLRTATLMCALAVCSAAISMTGRFAFAQVDAFEFEVYPAQTLGAGMIELESLNSFVPKGHSRGGLGTASGDSASNFMFRTAFELSYGLPDKLE